MPKFTPGIPLLLLAALGAGCSRQAASAFKTATIAKADILSVIEATGTLEPEDVVDIGAQVTGQIVAFGQDGKGHPLDYGSAVEVGQLLAKIDDVPYSLSRQQAAAQLSLAEANVAAAEANFARDSATVLQNEAKLEQARAQFAQAEKDWIRAQKAGTSAVMTQAAFDAFQGVFEASRAAVKAAESTCEVSRAQAKASQASIRQAQSSIDQAKVAIALADRNLGYCTIASPVKGIIIDRRVDVGQTVVSNLSASSLFLLAKDLSKMQVWAAVNEADIGAIHSGQAVAFTTDAYPGATFKGTVDKVRLNAAMTQNVVTYTVEINTDNADGKLMPYLTANVKFEVARQAGTLAVPNAALRWQPEAAQISPVAKNAAAKGEGKGDGKTEGKGERPKGSKKKSAGLLWVKDGEKGEFVRPVKVRTGITDGVVTEVIPLEEGVFLEGQEVVTGQERGEQAAAPSGTNPFAPKPMGGGRRN